MQGKNKPVLSASRALAIACAAALSPALVHANAIISEYQFTNDTFNPTTSVTNLIGSAFSYVNANPSNPPFTNPPFIVPGSAPGDPAFFVGQGDWFPAGKGFNEDYFTFSMSVAPGFGLNAKSLSFDANSRQAVLMDTQVAYSNSPTFSNPVNFDSAAFQIPAVDSWNTFTASDSPITAGIATYYFRIYNQVDPTGSGTISDLLNLGNITLTGSIQPDAAVVPMYWDPASIGTVGSGGSGTWLGATPWADGVIDYAWSNTIAEQANFGGATGGTVALGGNVSALNGINFTTSGYNITGTAGQVLTVAGTINAAADATISASLVASGVFTKAGAGTLTIAGSATLGTGLSITGGTLKLVADTVSCPTADIASGAALEYNDSANTFQTPITYTGAGTLRETGSGDLIFGAFGNVNVDLSPGGLIDVEGGLLTGSSSYGGIWTGNQASLNIAGGASFNAVEAGPTGTMQIDALTGAGTFLGGYFTNSSGGLSTVTIGVAGGGGTFSGSLQDNPGARLGIIKTGSGTETFSGSNTYSGGTTVNGGTLVIGAASALPNGAVAIQSTGKIQLASGIGGVTIQSLSITGSGALDLMNNHLFVDYAAGTQAAADSTIRGYLLSGLAGGTWTGPGIDSSTAALPANNLNYGLGYADGADDIVAGLTSGQIEIKYTFYGDANLDGVVNGDDFTILAANLGKTVSAWDKGDFNYDGVVNGDDFTLLVENLGKKANGAAVALPAGDYAAIDAFAAANGLIADVPEPASVALFVLATAGILTRRRRWRD